MKPSKDSPEASRIVSGQTNTADPFAVFFHSHSQQRLGVGLAASYSLLIRAEVGFVHFHRPAEPIPPWTNHGAPQLVQDRPSCFVAGQAKLLLDAEGAGAVLGVGHQPHGAKPKPQRDPGSVKDRSRRYRRLVTASGTFHQPGGLTNPCPRRTAAYTSEALRPAKLEQVLAARLLGPKLLFELQQVSRVLLYWQRVHDLQRYRLWLPQPTG